MPPGKQFLAMCKYCKTSFKAFYYNAETCSIQCRQKHEKTYHRKYDNTAADRIRAEEFKDSHAHLEVFLDCD